MTTIQARHPASPQPLLAVPARIALALAVAAVLALASLGARDASHQAVRMATDSFSRSVTHVTLPSVEVVGRREAAPKSI